MADFDLPPARSRLVGQPLLYAISIFASLGVFLVRRVLCCPWLTHHPTTSSATIKGESALLPGPHPPVLIRLNSVMSGVITGPYFRQFFNSPGPLEIGTMVAVLELGALSMPISSIFPHL